MSSDDLNENEEGGENDFLENDFENNPFAGIIDPNAKILEPVQRRIKVQLEKQINDLFLETSEFEEGEKRAVTNRETIGVELYTRQQQLATLHEAKEKLDDNLNTISRVREEVDERRKEFRDTFEKRQVDLKKQKQIRETFQKGLDRINQRVLQVEKRNKHLQSEIAVHRTQAYRAEEQTENLEKKKRNQDFLLDQLQADSRTKQKEIQYVQKQLDEQIKQTQNAQGILNNTHQEMEALAFRKKTLMQVWKAAVIGMQKRDDTLEKLRAGRTSQIQHIKELENEKDGYHGSIQKERDRHEELTSQFHAKKREGESLIRQIAQAGEDIEQCLEVYQDMRINLEQIEKRVQSKEIGYKRELSTIESINKQFLRHVNELRVLESKEIEVLSDKTTFKKGTQSTKSEIEKVMEQITDREIDMSKVENEIAKTRIECIQTRNRNEGLQEELDTQLKKLRERDQMIEKYQDEIKSKHEEIESKQSTLDKLNRELEKLKANQQEENFGPLEATIHNLHKAIVNKEKENEQLNKNWIRQQSELVQLMNQKDELNQAIRELESKRTVLYQKHLRLAVQSGEETKEIKSLNGRMGNMHRQMIEYNKEISDNSQVQKDLASENFDKQNKIMHTIRLKEKETEKIEKRIKSELSDKQKRINELLEVEAQIMFWEKKIEIQKEIQETLDPEVGQDEIRNMKKEIHMMQQRLVELKREQKRKVHLMERSIQKRDIILVKSKAQAKRKVNTKASVKREINSLRNNLKQKKREKRRRGNEIKRLIQEAADLGRENEAMSSQIREREAEMGRLEEGLKTSFLQRSISSRLLEKERRVIQVVQKKGKLSQMNPEKQERIERDKRKLIDIIEELRNQFPNNSLNLDRVSYSLSK